MTGRLLGMAKAFAREGHNGQERKYTGEPYVVHCAEVAELVGEAGGDAEAQAVGWMHDLIEDTHFTIPQLLAAGFPKRVCSGVMWLTDHDWPAGVQPNRRIRKQLDLERLRLAPDWVQTIKVADLISNTSSIVEHDPAFARVYLVEKHNLLNVLVDGDDALRFRAWKQLHESADLLDLDLQRSF